MTSGSAQRPAPRRAQSAVRTSTSSRSPHCRISAARASLRTYATTSPVQIRASAASAEEAVAPAPRMAAELDLLDAVLAQGGDHAGDVGVVADRARPSSVNTRVLTASTEAAVSLISSSSGMTARLSGMVSDSPAHSGPSCSTNPGSAASSTSKRSYVQPASPSSS